MGLEPSSFLSIDKPSSRFATSFMKLLIDEYTSLEWVNRLNFVLEVS